MPEPTSPPPGTLAAGIATRPEPSNASNAGPPSAAGPLAPSSGLVVQLRREMQRFAPFSQMHPEHLDRLVAQSSQAYFAPGETVLQPEDGPPSHLYYLRQGAVTGRRGLAEMAAAGFQYEAGDVFPVGAVLGQRAVTATYHATQDTFCLLIPRETVLELAQLSPPFGDFLNRRVLQFLELSRRAVQVAYASQTLAEQSLEAPLRSFARKTPVTCRPDTPLGEALQRMHDQHIGSILVVDDEERVLGILTRHDVLGRVTLPQVPLEAPVSQVMTRPVHVLTVDDTAQEAALLMSRHGIRHVPITERGRLVSLVSERDLFAMQRLSLKQVSTSIRAARDVATLELVGQDIRRFAHNLLAQGVRARQLTELISHLNDVLTTRLIELVAERRHVDLRRMCWIALGSEGRQEQTIATDQDNGLVFASDAPEADRPSWLDFARDVNEALERCGFPLCKGGVMAMNPQWCLTPREWCERFDDWIEHGSPEDLLNAAIFFDFRPLVGEPGLVAPMRDLVTRRARAVPRFLRQMAEAALRHRPPLNWLGGLDTADEDGRALIDVKLQGTAIFVETARIYALAHGIEETSTRRRFEAAAGPMGGAASESEAWIEGFEFLQLLRLRVQLGAEAAAPQATERPNSIDVNTLNDIDRRVLKETLRLARRLQQRLELDYLR